MIIMLKPDEKIFKCDFLEEISLSLDENLYYNNTKNKKNKLDLNDPTSLFAAIVNLMKEKGPVEAKTIISNLEDKKDIFRKTNGSRYKQEFGKLIRITLNNNPELFYKEKEGNKYYFIENKTKYYLQKKRERALEKVLFNLKKKNTFLPINTKIQLDKVNLIIKRMEKKYKDDKKYADVMTCINLFKNLINKYLFLVKMDKINSLYELTVLNEKIIDICHTLEKIEKGELFFKKDDNIIVNIPNEYNDKNSRNIMFVEGANNQFNEPPDKIWLLYTHSPIYIIYYQIDCIYDANKKLDKSLYLKFKIINKYKYFNKHYLKTKFINLQYLILKLIYLILIYILLLKIDIK